ncbi:MAG: hypothetical protein OEV89_09945 [Desulfobulbaceae bacterium]|nr:hypothetical protein [Desulfobulbaceae bacterium]HIJ91013.1 hypothetical protein [Deltaproteobacteria bacterium]
MNFRSRPMMSENEADMMRLGPPWATTHYRTAGGSAGSLRTRPKSRGPATDILLF